MKNLSPHIILLLSLLIFTAALASDNGISVRPSDSDLIETECQQTVTTLFHVTNTGSKLDEFVPEIELPENWKLITKDFPFILEPNQTEIKLISFYVPHNAAVGKYDVIYKVHSREFPSVIDYYTVRVVVLPKMDLEVRLISEPTYVIAGGDYEIVYLITNLSNIAKNIKAEALCSEKFPVKVDRNYLPLQKGQSRHVTVTVNTSDQLIKNIQNRVKLTARFEDNPEIYDDAISTVEIIPAAGVTVSQTHNLPVSLKISEVIQKSEKWESGFQGDLYASGTIDAAGKHHVSARFRGPDIYRTSILAQHDAYTVFYKNPKFQVAAGDRNYSLSTLTERYRYSRGLEASVNLGAFSLGGFYQKTRWTPLSQKELAFQTSYHLDKKNKIDLNFLHKETTEFKSDIISAGTFLKPSRYIEMNLEYAFGKNADKMRYSYLLDMVMNYKSLRLVFNRIYADTKFPGYYDETDFLHAGFSINVIRNLNLQGYYRNDRKNFDLDTTRYSAPYERHMQFGLRYRLSKTFNISAFAEYLSRTDRLPVPKFDYRERIFKLFLVKSFKNLRINGSAEYGRTKNEVENLDDYMERYKLALNYSPFQKGEINGYMYYDNNIRYSNQRQRMWTLGANITYNFRKRTSLWFNYQNNFSPEEYYLDRNIFEIRFRHTFSNNHSISLRTRQTLLRQTDDENDTALLVDYTIPFSIPVSKTKNFGIVKGYVRDGETGKPMQNVIIRINGSTAISEKDGFYKFNAVKPKTYFLSVDKSDICFNCVTLQKTPMRIEVAGGEELEINMDIVRAAKYSGRIIVYKVVNDSSDHFSSTEMKHHMDEFYIRGGDTNHMDTNGRNNNNSVTSMVTNGKTKLIPDYTLANILIEMKQGEEVLQRVSDENGYFSFDDIRPGKWVVHLYDYNLPDYYRFEKGEFELELTPGDQKETEIRVLPEQRKIRFLQEGGTIIQSKN